MARIFLALGSMSLARSKTGLKSVGCERLGGVMIPEQDWEGTQQERRDAIALEGFSPSA